MAQHDYEIANASGSAVRADINAALLAIVSNNSATSAPSTTFAYMWWADSTNGILKMRNAANNAWIEILQLDGTLTMEDGAEATPGLAFRDDLDTGLYSPSSNVIAISTGATQRLQLSSGGTVFNESGADVDFRIEGDTEPNLFCIDASADRVGIGTASPTYDLTVESGNASLEVKGVTDTGITGWSQFLLTGGSGATENYITSNKNISVYLQGAEKFFFGTDGNFGMGTDDPFAPSGYTTLELSGSTGGCICFSDDEVQKWEVYGSDDEMGFYTRASTEYRLKLKKTGNVEITNGDLVLADTHGIDFSAATSGQTGVSSLVLDAYEEGTWTPNTQYGPTRTKYQGHYTKVGDTVHAWFVFDFSGQTDGGTGHVNISNLPFNILNATSNSPENGASVGAIAWGYLNYGSTLSCFFTRNTDNVHLYTEAGATLTGANLDGKYVEGCAIYKTAT